MQALGRLAFDLQLRTLDLALGAVGQCGGEHAIVHRQQVHLNVGVVVIEEVGVDGQAAVEPLRLQPQLIGIQLFRVDRGQLRQAGRQPGVETARAETVGVAEEHPQVVVDAVLGRQVVGPGFPGLVFLAIAVGAHATQRDQRTVGGGAGQLHQIQVDVLFLLRPAQAASDAEVVGEVVGQVAKQRVAVGAVVEAHVAERRGTHLVRAGAVGRRPGGDHPLCRAVEVFVEVVRTQQPVQRAVFRRGQAQLLRPLAVAVVGDRRAVDLVGGVVGVAGGAVADVVVGADRGQGVVAQVVVERQRGAVVVQAVVFVDVQRDVAAMRAFVADVVVAAHGQRTIAAVALELAAVDLEQGVQVGVELGQELQADGFLVHIAIGVAVEVVVLETVTLLGIQRHSPGQLFVHQRAADGAGDDAFVLAAKADGAITVGVEGGLLRDHVHCTGSGVLAIQGALGPTEYFDALQVEQRPTACDGGVEVDVIGVDAHREDRCRAGVAGAQAADVPTRAAVAVGVLGRGVGHEGGDVAHRAHAIGGDAGAFDGRHGHRDFLQRLLAVLGGDRDGFQGRFGFIVFVGGDGLAAGAGQQQRQADLAGQWIELVHGGSPRM